MAREADEPLIYIQAETQKRSEAFESRLMLIIALVSVDEAAHPEGRVYAQKSSGHIHRFVANVRTQPRNEDVGRGETLKGKNQSWERKKKQQEKSNNSFISGEVAGFAMEILMVRNYAQHA